MSNYKRASQPGRSSILSTLQATTMLDTKPVLPAEILVSILDFLPVSDQISFAKTSRRMKEMVYDDTRWVSRLVSMGCWDEAEARRRFEEAIKRKREAAERANAAAAGATPLAAKRTTLFDAGQEEERRKKLAEEAARAPEMRVDGFETLSLHASTKNSQEDPTTILDIYKNVRSIRGYARQEYGKIYGALAPFYYDLAQAKSHTEPAVFKAFRDPEKQAQMLRNLQRFSQNDWAQGWNERGEVLTNMCNIFENAVLREFEQGYESWDVEGKMKRYAHVLHDLNGGNAAMDVFVSKHPILNSRDALGNPMDCINQAPEDGITLEPSRAFFKALAIKFNEQSAVISQIFPDAENVFWTLLDKVREDIIGEYITPILDESHDRNLEAYLKAASGLFEQCMAFVGSLDPPSKSKQSLETHAKDFGLKTFDLHLDLYLREELDFFTKYAEREVLNWEQKLSEQDASVESFYMGNFNRRAAKNDFLSSFKKVVMMPVTVLPTIPISSPFGSSKSTAAAASGGNVRNSITGMPVASQTTTPDVDGSLEPKTGPLPSEAPTDELKAKAALMANRLEGIKSLFSIEVALDLVGSAREGLGRIAVFIRLGGQAGEEAREQCEAIFITLLKILGQDHVKNGFVKAVDHLSKYKAREVSDHDQEGVAPLVTFIELVNVGDLISQMIDVFYEQQLAAPKISDRNDFLDPAGLAKKKWEQMLDESVAAGLNKGIDVLMDEVEYICATTQLPTDFNPPPASQEKGTQQDGGDMGPTQTAIRVKDLVASHTNMLVGSTEKTMLDVFNGEVGLRLFTAVCKHLKRQRISTEGAMKLIADMTLYYEYIRGLKNQDLLAYFKALRELSQIYLIDAKHAKEMATIIADGDRFGGIFRAEEVYEYAERRADWYQVKRNVERAMYGMDCSVM
ncbi:F-box protein [Apiospora aurea]|uniref:F-box protein n=1 Tax=Apiospora aurea TaxID=335848 RepID=A0ABR1QTY3_9PEZI